VYPRRAAPAAQPSAKAKNFNASDGKGANGRKKKKKYLAPQAL